MTIFFPTKYLPPRWSINLDIGKIYLSYTFIDVDEPICLRIEFGPGTLPDSNFTPSSVIENVQVPAGTYIEGPIGRVSGSGFLAYLNR